MDNHIKFVELRTKYEEFVYEGFSIELINEFLELKFDFHIDHEINFKPSISIPINSIKDFKATDDPGLKYLVFHIGLIELISYWKSACPAIVRIKPYSLNAEQVKWWKKLWYKGLGEFFYLNGIRTDIEGFINIVFDSDEPVPEKSFIFSDTRLVPVGGGKDSAVTLELMKQSFGEKVIPFALNSRKAISDVVSRAGIRSERLIKYKRTIDPVLLDLNSRGYLNGHTPFSALLAFITLLASVLTGSRDIVLSNESSADEATDAESGANHQYSKTYEFEKDFRDYTRKFIHSEINYFSFLRPLTEAGISKLFSKMPWYFDVFRSCNAGSKSNSWCCNCPKCLFTTIILSPFIEEDDISRIFGKNILRDQNLLPLLKQLIGEAPTKPFECVGTMDEVRMALSAGIARYRGTDLPYLLRYFKEQADAGRYLLDPDDIYHFDFSNKHFLNKTYLKILRDAIS